MHIILASGSSRRKEILSQIGVTFTVQPAKGEERITKQIPEEVVTELSAQKAAEVAASAGEDTLVIGADTIVALEGEILGKPKDQEDAVRMLTRLAGRTHQVYTGVTWCRLEGGTKTSKTFTDCTEVEIYPMTEQEIRDYVETGEPLDKAGAYAVQGLFAAYVKRLSGDFYNVMGLPVAKLVQELKAEGISLPSGGTGHDL